MKDLKMLPKYFPHNKPMKTPICVTLMQILIFMFKLSLVIGNKIEITKMMGKLDLDAAIFKTSEGLISMDSEQWKTITVIDMNDFENSIHNTQ